MSTRHHRDRARGHLVLLRGGRDVLPPARDDADWQAFCARIGWMEPEPAGAFSLEDERNLVRRVLGTTEGVVPERDAMRAMDDETDAPPVAWAKRVLLASTMLAVAAAICFLVAATLSWQASVAARAVPEVERAPQPLREKPPVDRVEPRDDAPPSPKKTPAEPPALRDATSGPPGAIASRRDAHPTRTDEDHADAGVEAAAGAAVEIAAASGTHAHDASAHDAGAHVAAAQSKDTFSISQTGAVAFAVASARALRPDALDAPRATPAATTFEGARAMPVDWSISPSSDRWYGASLPPSPATTSLPAGVGVVAQLDIGKAIAQF